MPLFPSVSRLEVDYEEGPTAVVEFEGDLFETEDQRNWTDASFKTYCTPLALGFPHELKEGEELSQRVTVVRNRAGRRPVGAAPSCGSRSAGRRANVCRRSGSRSRPPTRRPRSSSCCASLAPAHVRVDVHVAAPAGTTRSRGRCVCAARRAPHSSSRCSSARATTSRRCARRSRAHDVARVLVAPEGAQTVTDEETTPPELVAYARAGSRSTGVPFAGGTDMYFCELNRTRPQVDAFDGVFWSLNAQVHAFDDVSLLETPEAQGEQVRAAKAFAAGKPLFVGPVTLKRRYNVNATVADAEPDPPDPRQALPIAAAWTAASAKHLTEQGAAAITYFETTGPRGVADNGEPLPAHRVLADLCGLRGADVLACETTRPLDVAGLALRRDGAVTLLAANLTPSPQTVAVRGLGSTDTIDLAPYEVVRIDA